MNKEECEDIRTKQDLLFEVSSLGASLSNEIIKNEKLEEENKQLKQALLDIKEYCGDIKNTHLVGLVDRDIILDIVNKALELEEGDSNE